jgi:hypothetical protein
MRTAFACIVVALTLAPQCVAGDDATFASQRALQLRNLAKPDAPQPVRLNAVEWLGKNIRDPKDNEVFAAIDKAIKDPDAQIRTRAVVARGTLAMMSKGPCPPSVVEAMLDPDPAVREDAINWSGVYPPKWYPQELAPVLLRCAHSEHAGVRSLGLLLLAQLPNYDPAMLQAAREGTADKHFMVRNDAHIALFRMTGKLEDIVPYCLRFRLERHDAARIQTGRLPAEEQAAKNLFTIGIGFRMRNLAEERTDDLAKYFVELLVSKDPVLRRAVAHYLQEYYREPDAFQFTVTPMAMFPQYLSGDPYGPPNKHPKDLEPPPGNPPPGNPFIVGQGDAESQRKQYDASVKKQRAFRQRLHELGLAARLQELRDRDPEGLVRGTAAQALRQMEEREKQDREKQDREPRK